MENILGSSLILAGAYIEVPLAPSDKIQTSGFPNLHGI